MTNVLDLKIGDKVSLSEGRIFTVGSEPVSVGDFVNVKGNIEDVSHILVLFSDGTVEVLDE